MTMMHANNSKLVLIDYQERLMPAIANAAGVTENARRLAQAARLLGVPVIQTVQYPKGLGDTVPVLQGQGTSIEKTSFGSCAVPAFMTAVAGSDLIVGGCETHVCVLQTVLGLLDAGHRVFVVADACGSRLEESRQLGLARMRQAGASIVTTEMVVFEWLGSKDHPQFKAASALIR